MMKWLLPNPNTLNDYLDGEFRDSLILGQELARRGLSDPKQAQGFLDPRKYKQSSPFCFMQMEKVVDRIFQSIDNNKKIGIWGDFDVDGQTSTAILIDGLSKFGAETVFHIPIRKTESHGVNMNGLKQFITENDLDLIITCDTGISDKEAIAYAQSKNTDVIITDHHKIPEEIPNAYAIINPHQLPENHPLSFLAGVGTAFQVIRALSAKRPKTVEPFEYIDLVALGTIADIAEQKLENRYYSQLGLERMNRSLRPALQSLVNTAETRIRKITENSIGFIFAPRLNAAGRLDDANPNVDFLLSNDDNFCNEIAIKLEELNAIRKQSVADVLTSTQGIINNTPGILNNSIFILSNPSWDSGVLGIAAGKLTELYNRPVILMREENNILSGSARSIEGIDITTALRKHAAQLISFGGHAMAAGLRISLDNFSSFTFQMEKYISKLVGERIKQPSLQIDHFISFSDINKKLVDELSHLSPFGPGNPTPIFATRKVELTHIRPIGVMKNHQRLTFIDSDRNKREVIKWNASRDKFDFDQFNIAYKLQPEDYKNNRQVYLELVDFQEFSQELSSVDTFSFNIEWEDYRNASQQLEILKNILHGTQDIQLWYEGKNEYLTKLDIKNRTELVKSTFLAILAAPPDYSVLQNLLKESEAKCVYFFNFHDKLQQIEDVLLEIGSILKYYIKTNEKEINLDYLAAKINQTVKTTRLAVQWFQAHGDIVIEQKNNGYLRLLDGKKSQLPGLSKFTQNLNKSLKETAAFRNYYNRVEAKYLFRKNND